MRRRGGTGSPKGGRTGEHVCRTHAARFRSRTAERPAQPNRSSSLPPLPQLPCGFIAADDVDDRTPAEGGDAEDHRDAAPLRRARRGARARGTFEHLRATLLSRISRLSLSYDGTVDAPAILILKTSLPDRGLSEAGSREVEFYSKVAAAMPARRRAATRRTSSRIRRLAPAARGPQPIRMWSSPTGRCRQHGAVRAHHRSAARACTPRGGTIRALASSIGTLARRGRRRSNICERSPTRSKSFAGSLGDRLPGERRDLYERLLERGAAPARALPLTP